MGINYSSFWKMDTLFILFICYGIGTKFVKKLEKELSHTDIKFETAFVGGMELLEYINPNYAKEINSFA